MEELEKALVNLGRALGECCNAFKKHFESMGIVLRDALNEYRAKNGRVKHLALYGKKARTRKKNYKRLLREGL